MHNGGYRITVVGHSLGAGAAALFAVALKGRGLERVRCYAFATPNCAGVQLCSSCADYVTSVVFRDDIVARVSPEALAALQRQLLDLDLNAALEKASSLKSSDRLESGYSSNFEKDSPNLNWLASSVVPFFSTPIKTSRMESIAKCFSTLHLLIIGCTRPKCDKISWQLI